MFNPLKIIPFFLINLYSYNWKIKLFVNLIYINYFLIKYRIEIVDFILLTKIKLMNTAAALRRMKRSAAIANAVSGSTRNLPRSRDREALSKSDAEIKIRATASMPAKKIKLTK